MLKLSYSNQVLRSFLSLNLLVATIACYCCCITGEVSLASAAAKTTPPPKTAVPAQKQLSTTNCKLWLLLAEWP